MLNFNLIIIVVAIFSFTVISIMVFILVSSVFGKKEEEKFKKLNDSLGVLIKIHLDSIKYGDKIPNGEMKHVRSMLKDKLGLEVFAFRVIENAKSDKISSVKYIKNYEEHLVKIFLKTDRKSIMKFAYSIYLIGEFRINNKEINRIVLDNLNSDSIYVRANSLKALSKIGDVKSFSDAIRIISLRGLYFNEKIIIDAIDSFEGDIEELNNILIDEIKNFTEDITNVVINHFENTRYVGCRDFLLNMLKSKDTPPNTIMRVMRYFHFVHYYKAESELIKLLESSNWQVRAVAAKAISRYDLENYCDKLSKLVSDSNYNVRYNAAMTLINSNSNQVIIDRIINGEDKYARDIVIYALFTNNKITYEKYLELLGREEEKSKYEAAVSLDKNLALGGGE